MRPEDISEDVWEAAGKPTFRVNLDFEAQQLWDIRPTIARAIMAERERAASYIERRPGNITERQFLADAIRRGDAIEADGTFIPGDTNAS